MKGRNVKKRDLKLVGYVAIILGALFLAGGIFAFSYDEMYPIPFCLCMNQVHPYAKYSATLLATGIVLVILGLLSVGRAHFEVATQD
jgi:hypothetical protein